MIKLGSFVYKLIAIPGVILISGFDKIITLVQGDTIFFDPANFPWVRAIEDSFPQIHHELTAVLGDGQYIPRIEEVSPEQERIIRGNAWKSFLFYTFGHRIESNCNRCPKTMELLEQIPGMQTAIFSILDPKTRLTPHRGVFKGVLRYHLALIVPDDPQTCGIRVGNELRHWKTGRSMIFDDTHTHEAWNDSDEVRVVLIVDFLRQLPFPISALNKFMVLLIGASPFIKNTITNLEDLRQKKQQAKDAS